MNYRPLPPDLIIKSSQIHGLGVFCQSEVTQFTDFGCKWRVIGREKLRLDFGGFVNHSKTPNCIVFRDLDKVDLRYHLLTLRKINVGEELTVDYTLAPSEFAYPSAFFGSDPEPIFALTGRGYYPGTICYCRESHLAKLKEYFKELWKNEVRSEELA